MSVFELGPWQWLAVFQQELLLFAGVFFLIGAIDDLAVDLTWLWLRLTGRASTPKISRIEAQQTELRGAAAIFIPAWKEADVIGDTIAHMLKVWPQKAMRLYVGIYHNDPETLAVAMASAKGDTRLRLVIHDRDGPSTKADCLNRLYAAMQDDECRMGFPFTAVVFHDAEDMVDPAGLVLLERAVSEGTDFVQLPVEPLPQAARHWLGSHYCEEFAEAHGKAMIVRDAIGAALPAAGVGCAVSREALGALAEKRPCALPFEPESLTEDYELGLAISENGGTCRFIRARGEDDMLIATRAYFPSQLGPIVRQKTRWVLGISLQGWDRIGWTSGFAESWMRARDRRGPLTALVLLLGYTLLALTLVIAIANSFGLYDPLPLSPFLTGVLWANLGFFAWRSMWRFAFTARNYGVAEGVFSVMRIPVTNVIAIMSGRRAVSAYIRTLTGEAAHWDKTDHNRHPTRPALSYDSLTTMRGTKA